MHKRIAAVLALVVILPLGCMQEEDELEIGRAAYAGAPRSGRAMASIVYGKCDPTSMPNYPWEGWNSPKESNRQTLSSRVWTTIEEMSRGTTSADWCDDVQAIWQQRNVYFDSSNVQPENALIQFSRDWERVADLAGCLL
jgi:hypothetical protein